MYVESTPKLQPGTWDVSGVPQRITVDIASTRARHEKWCETDNGVVLQFLGAAAGKLPSVDPFVVMEKYHLVDMTG